VSTTIEQTVKKYNVRKVAELGLSEDLVRTIINLEDILSDNFNIFIQATRDDEDITSTEVVITDHKTTNNDALILAIQDAAPREATIEIIGFVEAVAYAQEDGFDELLIYDN